MQKISSLVDPFVIALLLTLLLASFLPAQGNWAVAVDQVAKAGIILLFFLHGARLSRQALFDGMRNWRLHLMTLAMTFAVFPVLGLALVGTRTVPSEFASGLLFLAILPSTVQSSIAFTSIARGNVAGAVCAASFSNFLGIFLTPALATLLISSEWGGISWEAAQAIFLKLLLPFILGHASRRWTGAFVARHRAWLGKLDRTSILLIVYSAFGAAIAAGLLRTVEVHDLIVLLAICVVLLAVVMGIAISAAGLLGLDHGDMTVLLFCGSKKSLATGAPMAGVLFLPEQVGMILLPVIAFHQIQLIVCSLIAPRLRARAGPAAVAGQVEQP